MKWSVYCPDLFLPNQQWASDIPPMIVSVLQTKACKSTCFSYGSKGHGNLESKIFQNNLNTILNISEFLLQTIFNTEKAGANMATNKIIWC